MKPVWATLIFLALFALFYFTGSSPAPSAATVTGATAANGSLKGVATYDGEPPARQMIDIASRSPRNFEKVVKPILDDSLVVDPNTRGIQWVVVRIMKTTAKDSAPNASAPLAIDQKGAKYTPHILIAAPNTDIEILNPDKMNTNFHTTPYDSENPPKNFPIGSGQEKVTYKGEWLNAPDLVEFKCDEFSWMKGFILCHDPRYCAVSAADGTFEIKDLPAGKYKVNIWHEGFGNYMKKATIDVEIKAGAVTDLGEMKFGPKK